MLSAWRVVLAMLEPSHIGQRARLQQDARTAAARGEARA
jgi:hypothetical protein